MKTYTQIIQLDNNDPTLHLAMCLPYAIDSFSLEVEYVYYPAERQTRDDPGHPAYAEVQDWKVESFGTNGIDVVPTLEQQVFLLAEIDAPEELLLDKLEQKHDDDKDWDDGDCNLAERAMRFRLETRGE